MRRRASVNEPGVRAARPTTGLDIGTRTHQTDVNPDAPYRVGVTEGGGRRFPVEDRMPVYDIRPGMAREEVETLLGRPSKEASMGETLPAGDAAAGAGLWLCTWRKQDGTYTVYFRNGVAEDVEFEENP
jgi:hypothetical protein